MKNCNSQGSFFITSLMAFCTALRFLTVIPVSWRADSDGEYFKKSIFFFPLVGLLIGWGGWLLAAACISIFPPFVTAFILLFYLSGISGFLHLDGLADSGDGLLSYRPAEKSLEIMKDSRVGAMGVIVLGLLFLGKFSALASLSTQSLPLAMLLLPVGGRAAILITMALFPYARKEGGIGSLFLSRRSKMATTFALSLLFILAIFTAPGKGVFAILAVTFLAALLFGTFCKRRLGGITGDTLGAICELTEMLLAITLSTLTIGQV